MFIDTHCHLDFKEFDSDREQVIKGFKDNGIDCIINPGSDLEASCRAAALAQKHESIYAGVGIHPHHAGEVNSDTLAELKNLAQANNKVVAIGEVGLDYFRNLAPRDIQQDVFRKFIDLAFVLDLPLIIHDRDAHDDILKILKEKAAELSQQPVESRRETADLRGVVHCFSGDEILAAEFLKLGFYISFTGNITFKKAEDLRKVVAVVPVERMLLETDAPFLTPQKFRGQRNEPRLIKYIAEEIARIKGLSIKDIARITSLNVKNLFSIELGKDNNKGLIAYPIRDSLYLNITNRCTNDCIFCIRGSTDFVKGHNLRLENEPDVDRIIEAIAPHFVRDNSWGNPERSERVGNPAKYREVVFCGYGEPLIRLDVVLKTAKILKEKGVYIRINTNGHGNLIHGRSIVGDLIGLIDEVSVSLDTDTADKYNSICQPKFGSRTYEKIKEFIAECKKALPKVGITCIDLREVDMDHCRKIAEELGVGFRARHYNEVG